MRRLRYSLLLAAAIPLTTPLPTQAAELDPVFAGPTEIQDTFLPSQLRYQAYPESASVLAPKQWSVNATVDWAADLARTPIYLFDGESVTSTLKIRHSPAKNWEFGLDLPYTVRFGGILDHFIEYVETTLNAQVQARYELPRDTYQAFVTDGKRPVMILHKGDAFQDATLRAKYQALRAADHGLNASIAVTLSVPSGGSTFGGRGISPGVGMHFDYPIPANLMLFKGVDFFFGGAGNYYSSTHEQDFYFNNIRGMGYGGAEFKFLNRFSVVTEYQIYTAFASATPILRKDAHYYSFTGRIWVTHSTILEAGVVENLGILENRNSSDVTFKFSLTHRF